MCINCRALYRFQLQWGRFRKGSNVWFARVIHLGINKNRIRWCNLNLSLQYYKFVRWIKDSFYWFMNLIIFIIEQALFESLSGCRVFPNTTSFSVVKQLLESWSHGEFWRWHAAMIARIVWWFCFGLFKTRWKQLSITPFLAVLCFIFVIWDWPNEHVEPCAGQDVVIGNAL